MHCNLKFVYYKASVKSTDLQTALVGKNTSWQTKPHWKLTEHKMCLVICIVTKPHLGKVCIFYQYCYKVAAIWLTHCCVLILVVGIIIDYVSWKHCLNFKKDSKNGAPNFWPSNHYSSVVQTVSFQNLQKTLKSNL